MLNTKDHGVTILHEYILHGEGSCGMIAIKRIIGITVLGMAFVPVGIIPAVLAVETATRLEPVLYFSDLTDGPTSGWEQSTSKGAAVSIWGNNFGTTRGSSTVTVCGVTLKSDSDFAEWAATKNPYVSRGMQRTTFWLKSSMATGAGTISVTTVDGTSNAIPFHCRALGSNKIYFVANDGSDNNSGLKLATPIASLTKMRQVLLEGDIAYLRSGVWTENDPNRYGWYTLNFDYNHANGALNRSITVASYPGEVAQLGNLNWVAGGKDITCAIRINPIDKIFYWTFSKLVGRSNNASAFETAGGSVERGASNDIRIIGCDFTTSYNEGHAGSAINLASGSGDNLRGEKGASYYYIYGNYLHDTGSDYRGQWPGHRSYGLYFNGYGTMNHIYVGWNEIGWNERGRGIQVYAHTVKDTIDNLYIHDNYLDNNGMQGIVLSGGDPGDPYAGMIAKGYCSKCVQCRDEPTDPECDCCMCIATPEHPNVMNPEGCKFEYVKNSYIYNNIFFQNGENINSSTAGSFPALFINSTFSWGGQKGKHYIYNNTFYENYQEYAVMGAKNEPINTTVDFKNNLFYHTRPTGYGGENYPCSNCTAENNLFYGQKSSSMPAWFNGSLIGIDPQFAANPPATVAGFALKPTSPAANAGKSTAPIVLKDFVGLPRPNGSSYSIGAYEEKNTIPPASPHLQP